MKLIEITKRFVGVKLLSKHDETEILAAITEAELTERESKAFRYISQNAQGIIYIPGKAVKPTLEAVEAAMKEKP